MIRIILIYISCLTFFFFRKESELHFCISFNQEKDQVEVLERQNNYFCIVTRIVLKLSNKAVEIRKKKMVICNCVITKYENRYLEDFIFEYDTFESFMRLRNSSESWNSYIFCLKINKKIKKTENDWLQSKTTELSQFSTRKLVFESFPVALNLDMTWDPSGRALCNLLLDSSWSYLFAPKKENII